jgi:hypothetical protein
MITRLTTSLQARLRAQGSLASFGGDGRCYFLNVFAHRIGNAIHCSGPFRPTEGFKLFFCFQTPETFCVHAQTIVMALGKEVIHLRGCNYLAAARDATNGTYFLLLFGSIAKSEVKFNTR